MPEPTNDSLERLIDSMSRTIRVNGESATAREQHAEFTDRNRTSGLLFALGMVELLLLGGTLLMLTKSENLHIYKIVAAASAADHLLRLDQERRPPQLHREPPAQEGVMNLLATLAVIGLLALFGGGTIVNLRDAARRQRGALFAAVLSGSLFAVTLCGAL